MYNNRLFAELNENEQMEVNGGWVWFVVGGVVLVGLAAGAIVGYNEAKNSSSKSSPSPTPTPTPTPTPVYI